MANISKITILNGVTYDIVDSNALHATDVYTKSEIDAAFGKVVRADATQSLTSAEKQTARQNIGAISAADITFNVVNNILIFSGTNYPAVINNVLIL